MTCNFDVAGNFTDWIRGQEDCFLIANRGERQLFNK